ncbi:RpsU-divergently transcribed [Sphingomonas sp. Root710]|uniref:COQ9 family protein n=1 Tax=Sphingomonas sp. Root710 TaxID=1736594 RepID=UPI0006F801AA|nr:COQ9 family protein [Sphingomonas sp. Root710]KRB82686.1 RpsU-divergently transcribed [Sphingomonas sp. Root710]
MTAPDTIPATEMTLDELRVALAERIAGHAVFDGWTETALAGAAAELGIPADRAALCFPGGAIEMIDAWFAVIDAHMAAKLDAAGASGWKIRDRIRGAVLARLDEASAHPDALRRALAILARPANMARAARLCWRAADAMWRAAGDSSVDAAWYTKRATLAAVYSATLMAWMDDDSEGFADTRAFLDRRIDDVMKVEKLKARLKPDPDRHFSPARVLGRLRYRLEG